MNHPQSFLAASVLLLTAVFAPAARANLVTLDGAFTAASSTFTFDASAYNTGAADNPLNLYYGVHPYLAYTFQMDQAASVTFTMDGTAFGGSAVLIDPAVLVYQGTIAQSVFDPVAAAGAYVGGNDDIQNGVLRNSLATLALQDGTTYTLVLTTWQSDVGGVIYNESPFGGYQATLNAPSSTVTVAAIPEPATYAALLGLATLVLAIWRRR